MAGSTIRLQKYILKYKNKYLAYSTLCCSALSLSLSLSVVPLSLSLPLSLASSHRSLERAGSKSCYVCDASLMVIAVSWPTLGIDEDFLKKALATK